MLGVYKYTNNKRHYVVAKHPDPDTDLTACDVMGALALVVLVAVTFAACALWARGVVA